MSTVLVAGATGELGRKVMAALQARGHDVLALVRPSSAARVSDDVAVRAGEALRPETLTTVFDGVDVLVSCLGASTLPSPMKGRAGFDEVDWPANRNLVDAAKAAGVKKVVYVSVAGAPQNRDLVYFDAHERVVDHLKASGLAYAIVRPTGFFSAVEEYLGLARMGVVPLFGPGTARSNPIADEDLANVVADAVTGERTEMTVGGPDVLERRQFGELAFAALGKTPRFVRVPVGLVLFGARILSLVLPRTGQAIAFIVRVSVAECIGEALGKRHLADHFASKARR